MKKQITFRAGTADRRRLKLMAARLQSTQSAAARLAVAWLVDAWRMRKRQLGGGELKDGS